MVIIISPGCEKIFARQVDTHNRRGYIGLMKISEYRRKSGLTQRELANLIGVTDVAIGRYEAGRIPEPAILRKIYDVTKGRVGPNDFYDFPALKRSGH